MMVKTGKKNAPQSKKKKKLKKIKISKDYLTI
jgi:hypothetical protein